MLEIQLEQKFGQAGVALLPEIVKIDDWDRLERLLAAIVKVDSLAGFRQVLEETSPS